MMWRWQREENRTSAEPRICQVVAGHSRRLAQWLRRGDHAVASVEFAICSIALFAFMLGIVNLGLLGLSLGALQHATEQATRQAEVVAAVNGAGNCPTNTMIQGYFNNYAYPVLSTGKVTISSSGWTDNASTAVPPGTFDTITANYNWKPLGFNFFHGITLKLTTVAFAQGSPAC